MSTTIARWIAQAAAGGAAARLRAEEPLSSGTLQVLASNATHCARENSLRTLWDWGGGPIDLSQGLIPTPVTTDHVGSVNWSGELGTGWCSIYAGAHRLLPYGERVEIPRLTLHARGSAPAATTLYLLLAATPTLREPQVGDVWGETSTTSATLTDLRVTLTPTAAALGLVEHPILRAAAAAGDALDEAGQLPEVHLWVAGWMDPPSGGLQKAHLSGLTIYAEAPA